LLPVFSSVIIGSFAGNIWISRACLIRRADIRILTASTGGPLRRWSLLLPRSFPASFAQPRLPADRLLFPAFSTRWSLMVGSSRLLWDLACSGCYCRPRRRGLAHRRGTVQEVAEAPLRRAIRLFSSLFRRIYGTHR